MAHAQYDHRRMAVKLSVAIAAAAMALSTGAAQADLGDQLAKLLADDGAGADNFGVSVAIGGTTAIVGAARDDDNGGDSGSAYLATLDRIELDHVQYGDFFDAPTGAQLGMTLTGTAVAGATFIFTDTPYLSADDSPFNLFGDFFLEDFEDGLLNMPGLLGFGGEIRFPGPFTDSVDADDGIIDGFGLDGHDFWAFADPKDGPLARFEFDPKVLGGLPRSVGVVWTDGNIFATTVFEAFGPNGESLGVLELVLGDDKPEGSTDEDRFMGVVFQDGISAIEISVPVPIGFEEPQEFPAFGEATVEAVDSFDAAGNDTPDLVVVIPGSIRQANGNVQVFLNQGNDNKTGDWIGLKASALIPVGNIPSDITAGFFNDDAFVDLAVSNAGDNQLSILLGDGNGSFIPGPTQDVGQAPSAVASADFNMDENTDLVVANSLDDTVWVLFGDGMGGFTKGPMLPTEGSLAFDVDPGDIDNDKDVDIVGINNTVIAKAGPLNGSVFVILNNGDGTFAPAVNYPVGIDPRQLAIADIDGDTFNDVVVVNFADATVSVLLNQGDGTFGPAIEVGVGTSPRSIDAVDLDGDGDPDLVIAADNAAMEPVVQVLANITSGIGEVEFQLPLEFSVNADPNFVANADFNADELPDIVTANTDDGKTGGSVTVLLNDSPPLPEPCLADFDNSGDVGVKDLLFLLGAWGPCPKKGDCPADFDTSGDVGVKDLLFLLGDWGPCP